MLIHAVGEAPEQQVLAVVKAAAHTKGNTASAGGKMVQLENGTSLQVPLYVVEGDNIVVKTDTGTFVRRT